MAKKDTKKRDSKSGKKVAAKRHKRSDSGNKKGTGPRHKK